MSEPRAQREKPIGTDNHFYGAVLGSFFFLMATHD